MRQTPLSPLALHLKCIFWQELDVLRPSEDFDECIDGVHQSWRCRNLVAVKLGWTPQMQPAAPVEGERLKSFNYLHITNSQHMATTPV